MNRVEQKIEQIENLLRNYAMMEEEYKTRRKGDIYYNSMKLIKQKVTRLKGELEQLAKSHISSYTVRYRTKYFEGTSNFKISSELTSEEVISLFDHMNPDKKVTSLELVEIIPIGIPRN